MRTSTFTFPNARGFTLIELLTVLAILAIVLVLAVPAGQHLLGQNRAKAQINTLLSGLQYARSEAIVRNEKLTFCKSADHKTCGGSWRDGQVLLDSKENVLREFSALPGKDNLVWSGSAGLNDLIVWLPSGYTNGQRGSFYYCGANHSASQKLTLLDTGRMYVSSVQEGDFKAYCG